MTTWDEVRDYIQKDFPVIVINDYAFKIENKTKDGRSQILLIKLITSQDMGNWVHILSPIGLIPPENLSSALEKTTDLIMGGLVESKKYYYLKECLLLEVISIENLKKIIKKISELADELENEFVGGDSN